MTFEEITQLAKCGQRPPGMLAYEMLAWQNIEALSSRFRRCSISKEECTGTFREIKKAYERHRADYADLPRHTAWIKAVEAADSAYRLSDNHTPEADRLSNTILGLREDAKVGKQR